MSSRRIFAPTIRFQALCLIPIVYLISETYILCKKISQIGCRATKPPSELRLTWRSVRRQQDVCTNNTVLTAKLPVYTLKSIMGLCTISFSAIKVVFFPSHGQEVIFFELTVLDGHLMTRHDVTTVHHSSTSNFTFLHTFIYSWVPTHSSELLRWEQTSFSSWSAFLGFLIFARAKARADTNFGNSCTIMLQIGIRVGTSNC